MKRFILVLLFLLSLNSLSSQEFEVIRHRVEMGETVRMISRKYKVEPSEIYRQNKFAIEGVSEGMVLQFLVEKKYLEQPVAKQKPSKEPVPDTSNSAEEVQVGTDVQPAVTDAGSQPGTVQEISHTVQKGETLYKLSKMYNVSVDEIKAQNENTLKRGLQPGQVLTIRTNN